MTPLSVAQLLKDYGSNGVTALCVCAMVAMFFRLLTSQAQLVVELKAAQEKETAALRAVLPVVERLLTTVAVLEAKRGRRKDDVPTVVGTLVRELK